MLRCSLIRFVFAMAAPLVQAAAQTSPGSFAPITSAQGLSQGAVLCILQDTTGFMWFGTQNGLDKYDGKTFTHYRHNAYEPNSISENSVLSLYEDRNGILWVGTYSQGLNRFDPVRENFRRFKYDPAVAGSLSDNRVWAVTGDRQGRIWIGTRRGLSRLDPGMSSFVTYKSRAEDPNSISHDQVDALLVDHQGRLWLGTFGGGLNRYVPEIDGFVAYRHDDADPASLSSDTIKTLIEDDRGYIWIGTRHGGLDRFDPNTGSFQHYRNQPNDAGSLSENWVTSLTVDKIGDLWVGTRASGISRLNPETRRLIRFSAASGDAQALISNEITSMYTDRSGIVWVGTGRGLNKFINQEKQFLTYRPGKADDAKSDAASVTSIYLDHTNDIWIGMNGRGMQRISHRSNRVVNYRHDPEDDKSLASNAVWSIVGDGSGDLWVATSLGLNRMRHRTGEFIRYTPNNSGLAGLNLTVVMQDRRGDLWVGSWSNGLSRVSFDDQDRIEVAALPLADRGGEGSGIMIASIVEDRSENLWIGTYGIGLGRLDPNRPASGPMEISYIRNIPGNRNSLSSDLVNCVYQDRTGSLWIGTTGGGLNKFDYGSGTFTHFMEKDGLPSSTVMAILEDEKGMLWMTTYNGIAKFDPAQATFRTYDARDGLQGNEFNRASFKTRTGEMYFGGISGINSFFPERIQNNTYLPNVVFTRLQKVGRHGRETINLTGLHDLQLSYRDAMIAFEFAALDYNLPERNRYAYKLEGLDSDWIDAGNTNSAAFARLAPGKYHLVVRGSNNDGAWSEKTAGLHITVRPPVWRTPWAYGGYALLILGCVLWFLRVQDRKLRHERYVAATLKEANERLRMADTIKDEFLANTSHELRTPLNGMIGIAESLMTSTAGSIAEEQRNDLALIVASGKRLTNLVNDILDYARLRRERIELNKAAVNIQAVANMVLELSKPMAAGKDLVLENHIPDDFPAVFGDEHRIEQIFHNLVGNAVKFTSEGVVSVSAQLGVGKAIISVADTGIGISPAGLERIFESFEQVDGSTSRDFGGTGLGLAITRSLINLHGGEINVDSSPGEGSRFYFSLPLAGEGVVARPPSVVRQPEEVIARRSEPDNLVQHDESGFHLLVVDDEPINLRVLNNFLVTQNFSLTFAVNGFEALKYLRRQKFDLVLLDVMMPRMSGYDVCRKIREDIGPEEMPIVLLTARNQVGDIVKGFEAGANDYVVKPISRDELLIRLNTHLQLMRTTRTLKQSKEKLEEYSLNLENKVALRTREIQLRNRELETLDEIVRVINQEMDLPNLLGSLLKEGITLFERAERGAFLMRTGDSDKAGYQFAAVIGYDPAVCATLLLTLDEVSAWYGIDRVAMADEVSIVTDFRRVDRGPYEGQFPRPSSSLVMAIMLQGEIEGFLVLDQFRRDQPFEQADLVRLKRLKAHAVSAVAKARILEKVRNKNQQLIKAQKQLIMQEKMAYLGTLIAGIAHEIKNPLNFVNNFAEVAVDMTRELKGLLGDLALPTGSPLSRELTGLIADLEENTGMIHQYGKRADRVVTSMMMHSSQGHRERQAVDLNSLLEEQYELAFHTIRTYGEDLQVELQMDFNKTAESVEVHPRDISRAFLNLINNSLYAMAEKHKQAPSTYRAQLLLSTRPVQNWIEIRVRDNGSGIPQDYRDKVFNPFFTTKPPGKGIGLGLSICYDIIVDGHEGSLEVASEPGAWCEFIVRLPLAPGGV